MKRFLPLAALVLASCATPAALRDLRRAEADQVVARELEAEATTPDEQAAAAELVETAKADVEEAEARVDRERLEAGTSAVQQVAGALLRGLLGAVGVAGIAGSATRRSA